MPGLLTPALCFGGGALIGIGLFVALNWEPICDRVSQAMDEQRLYWEAIQEVRAQRQRSAKRDDEKPYEDEDAQIEKATGAFFGSEAVNESDQEEDQEQRQDQNQDQDQDQDQETNLRKRFTDAQRRRSLSSSPRPSQMLRRKSSSSSVISSNGHSSSERFAIYTVLPVSSSDEETNEESDKSDSNEFSSYDKLDSSDLSSY